MANWTLEAPRCNSPHFADFIAREREWLERGGRPFPSPSLQDQLDEARDDLVLAKTRIRELKRRIRKER